MRRYREIAGKLGWSRRHSAGPRRPRPAPWRTYYTTRNYIHMMRFTFQRPDLARRESGGAEDTDLLIRAVRRFDFQVVPEPLVKVHLHRGSNFRRVSPAKAEDYERLLDKHEDTLDSDPGLAAALLYKTGWLHYLARQRSQGRSFLLRSLQMRPVRLKTWAALLLLHLPGRLGSEFDRRLSELRTRRPRLGGRAGR